MEESPASDESECADCTQPTQPVEQCNACSPGCEEFCQTSPEDLRAFPGAEGFGAYTKGGRGGKVMFVENLNDSGSGSLRECAEAKGPRICLFKVAGTIELKDKIKIKEPFLTIAGQTAPGDGIALHASASMDDGPMKITAHDVIIRGLRIRAGASSGSSSMRRGISMEAGANNIILDHCSVSWATDDNLTFIDGVRDVTVQYSIISEGLANSTHSEGEHSKGFAISGKKYNSDEETGNITVHHNLFAHNNDRNVRHAGFGIVDFVNNVVYNWGFGPTEANDGQTKVPLNVIGNYYKRGPSTKTSSYEVDIDTDEGNGAEVYVEGNIGPNRKSDSDPEDAIVKLSQHQWLISSPHPTKPVTISSAMEAYEKVLTSAGALPHDAVDKRIINNAKTGTGKVIDAPSEVGGLPTLKGGPMPKDSDNDGIPDEFEMVHGFDPDRDDASEDKDGDGYTNIEEYINSLL